MRSKPTRRTFFGQAGAALAAPLAPTEAFAGARDGDRDALTRLAALEDVNAIRALQQRYARHVRKVIVDGDDAIEVFSDGTAKARTPCIVETATPIAGDDTLVEMARLQGDGVIKRSERRVLESRFVKRNGAWQLDRTELSA